MKRAIAYYRVSTARQGQSRLGLDAQKEAVVRYADANGYELFQEYVEVESGKNDKRHVLQVALDACKANTATLLIAKLDRLGRNVAFISRLIESKVDFKAVDNPHADKLIVHIMAAFAEHERDQISARTKAALKAAKARGTELGYNGRYVLSKENHRKAIEFARSLKPVIAEFDQKGITTIRAIKKELNRRRIRTATGHKWHVSTVHKLLQRLKEDEQ